MSTCRKEQFLIKVVVQPNCIHRIKFEMPPWMFSKGSLRELPPYIFAR